MLAQPVAQFHATGCRNLSRNGFQNSSPQNNFSRGSCFTDRLTVQLKWEFSQMRDQIITPHTRHQILKALESNGTWKGTRNGVSLRFQILKYSRSTTKRPRIEWWANNHGHLISGRDLTVFDASAAIDQEIQAHLRKLPPTPEPDEDDDDTEETLPCRPTGL